MILKTVRSLHVRWECNVTGVNDMHIILWVLVSDLSTFYGNGQQPFTNVLNWKVEIHQQLRINYIKKMVIL